MKKLIILLAVAFASCENEKVDKSRTKFYIESARQELSYEGKYSYNVSMNGGHQFILRCDERYAIDDTIVFLSLNALKAKDDSIKMMRIRLMNMESPRP